jgi:hypothetical protein
MRDLLRNRACGPIKRTGMRHHRLRNYREKTMRYL